MQKESFERTIAVLGQQNLNKLVDSVILIAGLGGVGGYALEALARMGVGHFILVDNDVFDLSNMNRQILCTSETIGRPKVLVAQDRVKSINPDAVVEPIQAFIDSSDIDEILSTRPNLVVDAIDSVPSKCLLLAKCVQTGIDVVSSMGAALRTDPLKTEVADISKTHSCPLAKAVRSGLRDYGIQNGIPCVFSTQKPNRASDGLLGSLPAVVGTFGLTLAAVASDIIFNKK